MLSAQPRQVSELRAAEKEAKRPSVDRKQAPLPEEVFIVFIVSCCTSVMIVGTALFFYAVDRKVKKEANANTVHDAKPVEIPLINFL